MGTKGLTIDIGPEVISMNNLPVKYVHIFIVFGINAQV